MKIFRGSTQNWTIFSGHFYALYRMGIHFFGLLKFQIFIGVFKIPDIFFFFWGGGGGGGEQ